MYTFLGKKSLQGAWRPFSSTVLPRTSSDCPLILQAPPPHKTSAVDSSQGGTTPCRRIAHAACIVISVHHTTPMNFTAIIRAAIRTHFIQGGDHTCSELVRAMGLDPKRHKGTIHAIMVDMERDGILGATRAANGKRDQWFIWPNRIRKRDRLIAALFA